MQLCVRSVGNADCVKPQPCAAHAALWINKYTLPRADKAHVHALLRVCVNGGCRRRFTPALQAAYRHMTAFQRDFWRRKARHMQVIFFVRVGAFYELYDVRLRQPPFWHLTFLAGTTSSAAGPLSLE